MAKLSLPDIGSLANSASARQAINDNFTAIEEAIENTVSRDGTTPNAMAADLDMDGNSVLNVADPVSDLDAVNKRSVETLVNEFAGQIIETAVFGEMVSERYTATAGQVEFILPEAPASLDSVEVFVDGVRLYPTADFSYSDVLLTLVTPLAGGEDVFVRYGRALPSGITSASAVTYTPPSTGVVGTVTAFLDSLWSTGVSAGAALIRFIQAGTSAIARTVQDKMEDTLHVKDFGATGDGITDDTNAILAAIAEADARGGAIIEFHGGTFLISETLVVDAPGIILRGRGLAGSASGGGGGKASYRSGASTRILWGGNATGPMYRLTSNAADDGTVSGIQGNAGVEGILFDCAEACARGIEIRSWTYATFRHVGVCYATEYGWLITTLENGVPSGAADTQHCEFFHCSYNEINTANPCDAGMVIGKGGSQTSQGNVSLCSFYNLHINVEGPGLALSLENVDNLYFFFYRGQNRTGVGGGGQTVFQAVTTGFIDQGALLTGPARYCMFFSCSGEFIAKEEPGTGTGSYGNMIFGLTRANARPLPTVEDGASLVCFETGGSGTAVPLGGSVTGRRRRGHLAHIAATTSIPNGTETAITSYNDTYNTESASLGSGVAGITVPNGIYNCSVEVQASWAVSATGWRQVTLLKNGAVVSPNVFTKANAPASGGAYVKAVATDLDVVPGDVLSLSVQHSAGGALNCTAADSWIRVRWY